LPVLSFFLKEHRRSLCGSFPTQNEELVVLIEKNQVGIESTGALLTSRLIEGNYPRYEGFIPKEFVTEVEAEKSELVQHVRLVSLLSSRINDIHLSIGGEKKKLTISARDQDLGENQATLDASVSGNPLEISFNWRYLLEGIQHLEGKKIQLKFTDSTKAALVRSPDDPHYNYIVMPIRA
jgi:DNA polymerase-3 subunit beta